MNVTQRRWGLIFGLGIYGVACLMPMIAARALRGEYQMTQRLLHEAYKREAQYAELVTVIGQEREKLIAFRASLTSDWVSHRHTVETLLKSHLEDFGLVLSATLPEASWRTDLLKRLRQLERQRP